MAVSLEKHILRRLLRTVLDGSLYQPVAETLSVKVAHLLGLVSLRLVVVVGVREKGSKFCTTQTQGGSKANSGAVADE